MRFAMRTRSRRGALRGGLLPGLLAGVVLFTLLLSLLAALISKGSLAPEGGSLPVKLAFGAAVMLACRITVRGAERRKLQWSLLCAAIMSAGVLLPGLLLGGEGSMPAAVCAIAVLASLLAAVLGSARRSLGNLCLLPIL